MQALSFTNARLYQALFPRDVFLVSTRPFIYTARELVMNNKPTYSSRTLLGVFFASFGFIACRFLLTPIRIKVLTSLLDRETYGALTLISVTVSFLTLVGSIGSLEYMLRKLPGAPSNYQKGVFRVILLCFGGLSVAMALVGAGALAVWQPATLRLGGGDLAACALMLVLTVHMIQRAYFLMARSEYVKSRLSQIFYAETWFLPLLLCFVWPWTLTASHVLWIWVTWLVLTMFMTRRWISLAEVFRETPPPSALRNILSFGLPIFPMILGEWLFRLIDQYVLLGLKGLSTVAVYALAVNIAMVGYVMGSSVLDILITEFNRARNRVGGRTVDELAASPELRKSFTVMLRYALTLYIPVGAALCTVGWALIRFFSGPKFDEAALILPWTAPIPLLFLLNLIFGRVLLSLDRSRTVGFATLGAALMTLGLNLALVPALGGQGAALANTLSMGCLAVFLGVRVHCWKWIVRSELRAGALLAFAVLSAGGLWSTRFFITGRPLTVLVAGAAWCVAIMFGLKLVSREDVHLFTDKAKVDEITEG